MCCLFFPSFNAFSLIVIRVIFAVGLHFETRHCRWLFSVGVAVHPLLSWFVFPFAGISTTSRLCYGWHHGAAQVNPLSLSLARAHPDICTLMDKVLQVIFKISDLNTWKNSGGIYIYLAALSIWMSGFNSPFCLAELKFGRYTMRKFWLRRKKKLKMRGIKNWCFSQMSITSIHHTTTSIPR